MTSIQIILIVAASLLVVAGTILIFTLWALVNSLGNILLGLIDKDKKKGK